MNRRAVAVMLRPGERCEAGVEISLPGPGHVTSAGAEGSFRYRLVQAIRERRSWSARYCCLITDQRVVFAVRQAGREFTPLLELQPQQITAAAWRHARPGWQVMIEFSDASAVSLDVSGPGAGRAARQLASLLDPQWAPGPRAHLALAGMGLRTRRACWLAGRWGALMLLAVAVAAAGESALSGHHAPAALKDVATAVGVGALACLALILLARAAREAAGWAILALIIVGLQLLLLSLSGSGRRRPAACRSRRTSGDSDEPLLRC